ncbi:NAD(P)/FAD-dependent oxidoreductase [Lichenifustis flavocetrariae]|uniref:FAD-binding oxidoreductase n=1 Tax=Lichenifustis flavocetrariae TaxID=2949735 RepID=A0AA42CQQ8_9HYPH|nr:FAD-binding oxidoreductase [Lichenifustis flavocetrariae]MCW6511675.1 FAD-binding oxidoreductase [Lichenifustis flavocetrariae]
MRFDIVVVGGGIAGAGIAYELSRLFSVIVVEREQQCGRHATGRSAASFTQAYGGATVRRLAGASRSFLETPPKGFAAHPLLMPRGTLTIARQEQIGRLEQAFALARVSAPSIRRIAPAEALARVPILRPEAVAAALFEPDAMDLDVHGLHGGFLAAASRQGARILCDAAVERIDHDAKGWTVQTSAGTVSAAILINAAGAWADAVARLAGVQPLGLVPKKRTAFLVPLPPDVEARTWPLVDDVGESFYFKHDAGQLFVSPADATPSEPVDVFADEIDVAIGADRLQRATTLTVRRVSRSWAGLRTFAPDGAPVVGPDPEVPDFIWLAGQGGTGIKTAPALSRACVSLMNMGRLPDDLLSAGLTAGDLLPGRLRGSPHLDKKPS